MNVELTGCTVHISPGQKSRRVVVMNENGLLELWTSDSSIDPGIYHGYTVLVAIRQYKGRVFLNLLEFREE